MGFDMQYFSEKEAQQYQDAVEKLTEQNTIQVVSLNDIKQKLLEEVKEFEFSPLEYVPGPDETQKTIFLKIANIMGELDRIPKSGYNKQFDYYYVTESDVVGAVRPLMAKYKLVMMPSLKKYKTETIQGKYNKMIMGTVEIEWIVRDAESYEQIKFTMLGKGLDNLEKDIYKAITGNKKYALITLFMIDSGDDPERNDTPTGEEGPQNAQNGPENTKKTQGNSKTPGQPKNGQEVPKNASQGQPQQPPQQPPVKQPTKGDLLTRWVVLAGPDQKKQEVRKAFDEWYEKKKAEGWDHMAMMQALTKKLHEKNQKEKQAQQQQADGQSGQAQQQQTDDKSKE
ncbi:DNA single strand annealing protein [Geobacillus phage TP-84]|uniref:DNA single-strand annealing protein n=1 Tax=Geobacillus phage TP-84 TaxID=1965361 RepID=A0A1U9WQN4_9CAUD|nr:Erf-like ssDNA annealing protein [Geobacillus phage TP-84]AQY55072.1 DNA single strand annealing protein [Geobacillus phage TP-84]